MSPDLTGLLVLEPQSFQDIAAKKNPHFCPTLRRQFKSKWTPDSSLMPEEKGMSKFALALRE
jgi:hypothetical protein